MKARSLVALLVVVAVAAWVLLRAGSPAPHLLLSETQVRPLEPGLAGVFATIENSGMPDRLIAVESPAARAELYDPFGNAEGLPVPVGKASLALDAAHIRLAGAFAEGTLVPLTLTFARAGEVTLKARVTAASETGQAGEVGLFGLGGICRVGEGEPAPEIALSVAPDGDGWIVTIEAREFRFSEEMAGLYHVPGMGHGHLYVGGMKLGRLYATTAHVGALPTGRHELRVTLNTNDHRAYVVGDEPVTATAVIVVD